MNMNFTIKVNFTKRLHLNLLSNKLYVLITYIYENEYFFFIILSLIDNFQLK